jgi:hypothetical protein
VGGFDVALYNTTDTPGLQENTRGNGILLALVLRRDELDNRSSS